MDNLKKPLILSEEIIDLIPANIYWLDTNNIYQGCNKLQAKGAGFSSPKDIIGKTNYDLPCYDSDRAFADLLNKNNLKVMQTGKFLIFEEAFTLNSGIHETWLSYKIPLRNSDDLVVGILGISFDITDRKRKETELIIKKELAEITLEHIITHMPGHVYWKDKTGIYLGCNDKQAQSLGLKSGRDVIGKSDFDLPWKKNNAKLFRENDLEVIKTGKAKTVEETAIVDNKEAIVLSQKVPLRDNHNDIIGILGISVDITEIKNYQKKLEQANQSKSEFLRIISHELTAPVSNIINSLDIIKNFIETEPFDKVAVMDYLDLAKQEAEQIKPKLNDVINYINFDENNSSSRYVGCNLPELVSKVFEKNSDRKSPSVKVNFALSEKIPQRILIDAEHLYIVLNIIIGNALKYTQRGKIIVSAEKHAAQNKQDDQHIKIIVRDTGPGIHAEQLKTILRGFGKEPQGKAHDYYRKPSVRLPYAKLIVEHVLKGVLAIESKIDEGTAITLTVPYKIADEASLAKTEQHQAPTPLRVLLVEDNEVSRRLESEMLKRLGCMVSEAATGHEAIALAESTSDLDFIFLDITLPDMNGIQVFEKIRKKLRSNVPVVALTSHATEEDIDLFLNQGMLTVIAKPVSFDALKAFFDSYKKSLGDSIS